MLGISYGQLLLVIGAVVAVSGPKDFPRVARMVGRMAGRAIGYVQLARGQFDIIMRQSQAQQRTWERAKLATTLDHVVVAMDDEKIAGCCRGFGADVVMTSDFCRNGTERCNKALQKLKKKYDVVVNIQGDEPLVEPEIIDEIVKVLQSYDSKFLKIYPELQPTPLQLEEDLEQLKVLENGYKMKVIKVDHNAHGVDTPEDVEKIERFMRERNLS